MHVASMGTDAGSPAISRSGRILAAQRKLHELIRCLGCVNYCFREQSQMGSRSSWVDLIAGASKAIVELLQNGTEAEQRLLMGAGLFETCHSLMAHQDRRRFILPILQHSVRCVALNPSFAGGIELLATLVR